VAVNGSLCAQGVLLNIRHFFLYIIILMCSACTTSGKLYFVDTEGNEKLGCDVEFVGMPSVDKYAVEYALSLCAKSIVKKGGVIQEEYLLKIDTSIPLSPCGKAWTHELAKQQFNSEKISKKEYGYIVGNIDLGLSEINECAHNKPLKQDK
jgi:hypothetical protein